MPGKKKGEISVLGARIEPDITVGRTGRELPVLVDLTEREMPGSRTSL
jgi:hypothetical protein